MSPLRKRKSDRLAEETARREARRKELSARLRRELREGGPKPDAEASAGPEEPKEPEKKAEPAGRPRSERKQAAKPGRRSKRAPREEPKPEEKARPRAKPDTRRFGKKTPLVKPASRKPVEKPESPTGQNPAAKAEPSRKTKPTAKTKPTGKTKPTAKTKPTSRPKPSAKPKSRRGAKRPRERTPLPTLRSESSKPGRSGQRRPGTPRPSGAERRRALGKRLSAARLAGVRGLQATGKRAAGVKPYAKKALVAVGAVLGPVAAFAFRGAGVVERVIKASVRTTRRGVAWTVRRLDRLLTPARVVAALTIACAAMAIVAQYVDYRGVQIGQEQYADVASIAPPPQLDVHQAADNHSLVVFGLQISVIVPIALAAALLAVLALWGRRRGLGRLIALAGVAGIAITLLVDMPKGLDEGDVGLAFAGAHAQLANGFYAELAACAGLIICGLLLSLHLRPARERSPGRRQGAKKRDATKRDEKKREDTSRKKPHRAPSGRSPLAKEGS